MQEHETPLPPRAKDYKEGADTPIVLFEQHQKPLTREEILLRDIRYEIALEEARIGGMYYSNGDKI